ncbi:nischarin related [Anaeramoeba flamelloides]|uniref:Nischarin related n=1 Tax=Anaeramoeba flamelloides TaxID=1746091 RepID=A0AAV8AHB2_9EUKA|nr:nischarin related [Anaeramoeba flamelloides]
MTGIIDGISLLGDLILPRLSSLKNKKKSNTVEIKFQSDDKYHLDSVLKKKYSSTVPFTYGECNIDQELKFPTCVPEIPKFMQQIMEPPSGIFLPGFDIHGYEKRIKKKPFINFIPHIFSRKVSPLRFPKQIPKKQQLLNPNKLKQRKSNEISLISFSKLKLKAKQRIILLQRINKFKYVEVLILRNCTINSVTGLSLPGLRICDLSSNKIKKIKPTIMFLKNSPLLEILDLRENPINSKKILKSLILANKPRLTLLNGIEIETDERIKAIEQHGSEELISQIGKIRWDLTLSSISEIRSMPGWYPQNLVNLILPNLKLTEFHVGTFRSLQFLDLSSNQIEHLKGTGLERCSKLLDLNLANNKIINIKQVLNVIPFCSSLQRFSIIENENLQDYRLSVIYTCRFLKGTNRQPGLSIFDEKPVTMNEYLLALEKIGNESKETISVMRWELSQINQFGNYQIRKIPDFLKKVTVANFSNLKIEFLTLQKYKNLTVLNLCNNNIKKIQGLNNLKNLKIVDLSRNPFLEIEPVYEQLSKLHNLISVSFATDLEIDEGGVIVLDEIEPYQKKEKLSIYNKDYRIEVISYLFLNNPDLQVLDSELISFFERVDGLIQASNVKTHHHKNKSKNNIILTEEYIEKYRFNLALELTINKTNIKKFHPSKININKDYAIKNITKLTKLSNLGLKNLGINLHNFINLQEINLSNNNITDMFALGLENLKNLKILDLSFNNINNGIKEIANWIDERNSLEILCLRGNICLNSDESRKNLIGYIKSMHEVKSRLRVLDTEITITERVVSWKSIGATDEQCNELRFKATIHTRLTREELSNLEKIKVLDLSNAELEQIDLTQFKNLKRLLLRNNNFRSLSNIEGLLQLDKLEVLDLRDNKLPDPDSIASLLKKLPLLTSFGINNNVFNKEYIEELDTDNNSNSNNINSDNDHNNLYKKKHKKKINKNWRQNFLNKLDKLMDTKCLLRQLDSKDITLEELFLVLKDNLSDKEYKKLNKEQFKFEITINRRLPFNKRKSKFKNIDLSYCELTTIDISPYVNLVKLSLRGNLITDKTFSVNYFKWLKNLEGLDFRDNKIKKMQTFSQIIDNLPKLKYLYIIQNPCYSQEKPSNRLKLFSLSEKIMLPGSNLTHLNGNLLNLHEICLAIASLQNKKKYANISQKCDNSK